MKSILFGFIKKSLPIVYISCLVVSCNLAERADRDHLVFRYNSHNNIASLDPAFARNYDIIWATNQLFNSLVQLDDTLQVRADIAKSWMISEDLLTYEFTLREDVYFHKHPAFETSDSTRAVVASDFVYSFDRLLDPKVGSPGHWVLQEVDSYHAVSDTLLRIQLKKPFPAFLGLLSMRYCSVVPKEAVAHFGEQFSRNPIGTGPFRFKMWEENIKLVFRRNPLYFEKDENGTPLPYLEAVAISFLPEKQSEFLQFIKGKLDLLNSLDASYKDELLTPNGTLRDAYSDRINFSKTPYLNTEYLGFYLDGNREEVQSILIRKAINYGFDRKKMIQYLKNGVGYPAIHGFIPRGVPGFRAIPGYSYQPEKAKSLVEAYKKESKNPNPKLTLTTDQNYLSICEFMQRELEKIGIGIEIAVLPASTIRKKKSQGQLELFRASWIADYPDAQNFLSLYYSKNHTPYGPNYTHFSKTAFDSLYLKSFRAKNKKERTNIYATLDSILISESAIVPLYYDEAVRFTHKNIIGLQNNPQNFLILKNVKKQTLNRLF